MRILVFILALSFVSCAKSKQDLAEDLVIEYMKTHAANPDTYVLDNFSELGDYYEQTADGDTVWKGYTIHHLYSITGKHGDEGDKEQRITAFVVLADPDTKMPVSVRPEQGFMDF